MIRPGSTLGILGGGQLGRMIALAAAQLGPARPTSTRPRRTARPSRSAAEHTVAAYEDEAALARFARAVDVVTYEFENVPGATAAILGAARAARPRRAGAGDDAGPARGKELHRRARHPDVAPFAAVASEAELAAALARDRPARRAQDPPLRL